MISKFIFNSTSTSKFNKMSETNHLCDLWEHTVVKVFTHDPKSELGLMLKQWAIYNKLENFSSILNYTIDDFTPSGNLSYINENGEIIHLTPLKGLFNLRWYIQYLIDESESEDESNNPLNHENWMKQTSWKFLKYVVHHKHSMTLNNSNRNLSKKLSRLDMNNLIQWKGSETDMKRKLPHLQTSQNKILNLMQPLMIMKMKKIQNKLKHFRFIMYPMLQCMMKTIHQHLKMIHLMKILQMKLKHMKTMGSKQCTRRETPN